MITEKRVEQAWREILKQIQDRGQASSQMGYGTVANRDKKAKRNFPIRNLGISQIKSRPQSKYYWQSSFTALWSCAALLCEAVLRCLNGAAQRRKVALKGSAG